MRRQPVALTIPGTPRTKKTSNRVVRAGRSGKIRVLPSAAWAEWCLDVHAWWVKLPAASRRGFPLPDQDYNICALIYRDALRGDAVGYYQGLADVLQVIGVVTNDVQLCTWDGSRLLLDRANPRVEITIEPIES